MEPKGRIESGMDEGVKWNGGMNGMREGKIRERKERREKTHPELSQDSHRISATVLDKRTWNDFHRIRDGTERPILNARNRFGLHPKTMLVSGPIMCCRAE